MKSQKVTQKGSKVGSKAGVKIDKSRLWRVSGRRSRWAGKKTSENLSSQTLTGGFSPTGELRFSTFDIKKHTHTKRYPKGIKMETRSLQKTLCGPLQKGFEMISILIHCLTFRDLLGSWHSLGVELLGQKETLKGHVLDKR